MTTDLLKRNLRRDFTVQDVRNRKIGDLPEGNSTETNASTNLKTSSRIFKNIQKSNWKPAFLTELY